jgi:hypothetical protein
MHTTSDDAKRCPGSVDSQEHTWIKNQEKKPVKETNSTTAKLVVNAKATANLGCI